MRTAVLVRLQTHVLKAGSQLLFLLFHGRGWGGSAFSESIGPMAQNTEKQPEISGGVSIEFTGVTLVLDFISTL